LDSAGGIRLFQVKIVGAFWRIERKIKMKPETISLFFIAFLLFSGCQTDRRNSGGLKSETREIFGFREIRAGNKVNLEITLQKDFSLTVEADENLLKNVQTTVQGETLIVSTKNINVTSTTINLRISMWELNNLQIWGASTAVVTGVNNDSLKIHASGTSNLTIAGRTTSLQAAAIGASAIDAAALKTEKANVQATGSSTVTVFAAGELLAESMGASDIFYLGEPQTVKQNIIGAGSVQKR
jgi:hypothetical protein